MEVEARDSLRIVPLQPSTWPLLEELFGPKGACGGCWCMTPRLTRSQYEKQKGEGNRRALKALVDSGRVPGVLGVIDGRPVGWCSIEPRELISSLARSRIFKPIDDRQVWSIVCLFIARPWRKQGISSRLIEGACRYARRRGAQLVEAYPVEPRKSSMPEVFAFPGIASAYLKVGFEEVARRSETRPMLRLDLNSQI